MDIDIDKSFGVLGKGDHQHMDLRYIYHSMGLSVLQSNTTFRLPRIT